MRRITSGSISFNDDYPPDISNPVNTNYMFIEKLNAEFNLQMQQNSD